MSHGILPYHDLMYGAPSHVWEQQSS